jgi:hypothetical protein
MCKPLRDATRGTSGTAGRLTTGSLAGSNKTPIATVQFAMHWACVLSCSPGQSIDASSDIDAIAALTLIFAIAMVAAAVWLASPRASNTATSTLKKRCLGRDLRMAVGYPRRAANAKAENRC